MKESKEVADRNKRVVEEVCSFYGLDSKTVTPLLKEGFSKSDVYLVCESLHNNQMADLASSTVSKKDEKTEPRRVNLSGSFASNRRGM